MRRDATGQVQKKLSTVKGTKTSVFFLNLEKKIEINKSNSVPITIQMVENPNMDLVWQ